MPFTGAHPLAVAPLVRWSRRLGLDPTCLVVGSLAPDFEYFVRGEQLSAISHTLRGLVLWDLPATLVLAAVFHALLKQPLLWIAPVAIARRAAATTVAPWRARWGAAAVASCAVSALIGSASHLAWDALTHSDSWGPRHVPWLRTPIAVPGTGLMAAHRVLQHASTVVGLVVLGALVLRWLLRARPAALPSTSRALARTVYAACMLAAAVPVTARAVAHHGRDPGNLIVGAIAGMLAGAIVASAVLSSRARRFCAAITAGSGSA